MFSLATWEETPAARRVRSSVDRTSRRKRCSRANRAIEVLESRQLLTAPPASAPEFFPALNQTFTDFLNTANTESNAAITDAVTDPISELNGSLTDARNQVLQNPMLANVASSVTSQISSLPMNVGTLYSTIGAIPNADAIWSWDHHIHFRCGWQLLGVWFDGQFRLQHTIADRISQWFSIGVRARVRR